MKFLFAGNWKMNPASAEEAKNLFGGYKRLAQKFARKSITFVVAPSFPHIGLFSGMRLPKNLKLAGQDCFYENQGKEQRAYTGRVSALQLYGVGADYVILGHSELRDMGDSSEIVARKIKTAVKAGLIPIVCVGENHRDFEGEFWHELRAQIENTFRGISKSEAAQIIVAYEPVWAIGEKATEAVMSGDLHQTALFIKKVFDQMYGGKIARALTVLYGGSVTSDNAKELSQAGVSGFLVGRASLNKKDTLGIINAVLE